MREWRRYTIRQLVGAPISGKRPTGGVNAESEGIPSLGGENIRADGGMDYKTINRVPLEFFRSMPKGRLQANDVLINKDGAQTGKVGLYDGRFDEAAVNEHVFILRSSSEAIDQRLLYYFMLLPNTQLRIARRITGSAQPGLSSQFADAVHLTVPSERSEQRRIAEVLSTVDEAIEQTEALIAKTQQIKAGLMHDLFTRGVTTDGALRPPREEAPQLYKESPLGWIPKEWECETLNRLLAPVRCPMRSGPFGSSLLKDELVENGIPLLGIDNVFPERFVADYSRFVTPKKFVELSRYAVLPGDVIITIMGTVGRCCVVPDNMGRALSSKHLWTMTFDRNKVVPELICWQLNDAPWVQAWFARQSQGAVMDAIQSSTLRNLTLPVPPLTEQFLLRDRYLAVQRTLIAEGEHLLKNKEVRQGLMKDLLTGRVPVGVETMASNFPEVAGNV